MMTRDNNFKDTLFFESVKEFWNERGRGARYRLTTVGISFFKEKVTLSKSKAENIEEFKKYLIDNNYCQSINYTEDNFSFTVEVEGCCLRNIREKYENNGMEILCCPIANMFMYIMELETRMSPELIPVQVENNVCKLTIAKMGTEEVTEKEE